MDFYFHTPYAFILLCLVPFLILRRFEKNPKSEHPLSMQAIPFLIASGTFDPQRMPVPIYIKYRHLIISFLKILTWVLLVVALARPQSGTFKTEEEADVRDLLITLDTSGSMKALDFEIQGERVSRLNALQSVVDTFIQGRKSDRMGLMVFGADVYTQCPLTLDHDLLRQYVQSLEIGMAGDSTALGDALALSIKRLKSIPSKSKAIILVTDGLKNSGQVEPRQAAEIAKRLGVRVYTIGIGGKAPAPFPVEDIFGRSTLIVKEVPLDEDTLKFISQTTGGKYFNAVNTDELEKVYKEIDSLETRKERTPRLVSENEHCQIFLVLGFFLFILTEILSRTILRVIS